MNIIQSNTLKKVQLSREIHLSTPTLRFAVNEARRKQRRKNWRTLAKQLGLNPGMANATIKKEAQIRGAIPAKQFMLEQWAFQKTVTLEEKKERRAQIQAKLAKVESRPVFEGGRLKVDESEFTREFWRAEIEVEKEKTIKAIESNTE